MREAAKTLRCWLSRTYGTYKVRKCGFWFVDIPRTSSTSIRVELGRAFGMPYGKPGMSHRVRHLLDPFGVHVPASRMREMLGAEVWDQLFTFALVRNPWERTVSLYNWRRKEGSIPHDLSFKEYVRRLAAFIDAGDQDPLGNGKPVFRLHFHCYGASDFILDDTGHTIVSYIGRYETRQADLRRIADMLNFPKLGELKIQQAPSAYRHYSKFYDAEARYTVGRIYRNDVEIFGYTFEDAQG